MKLVNKTSSNGVGNGNENATASDCAIQGAAIAKETFEEVQSPREIAKILIQREAAFRSRETSMKRELERLQQRLTNMDVASRGAEDKSEFHSTTTNVTPTAVSPTHSIDAALRAANLQDEDVAVFSDLFSYQSLELSKMKCELEHTRDELESLRESIDGSWSGSPMSSIKNVSPRTFSAQGVMTPTASNTILDHLNRSHHSARSMPLPTPPRRAPPPPPVAITPPSRVSYAGLHSELDAIGAAWGKHAESMTMRLKK